MFDVIVLGAGAGGLTAAIHAARAGAKVLVIEKTDACGKKLSMTGNGRCNLSNLEMGPEMYNASAQEDIPTYFERFSVNETVSFFSSIGVVTQEEGGYLYPVSGQAMSVVSSLQRECDRLQVTFVFEEQVKAVSYDDEVLAVSTDRNRYASRAVIFATGALSGTKKCGATGDAYYILEKLGISSTERYPALVPLLSNDETLPEVSGVRAFATLTFMTPKKDLAAEYGEVQFTKGMLSGIPVLQASDVVAKALALGEEVTVRVDLFPSYDDDLYEALVLSVLERKELPGMERVSILDFLNGFHNSYLNETVLRKMKLSTSMKVKNISKEMLRSILMHYRRVVISVDGAASYEKAQATAGGVPLSAMTDTLMVKRTPGVFLAGELLDVNGRCGGYNLQWAWTSGAIAGKAAAEYAKQ